MGIDDRVIMKDRRIGRGYCLFEKCFVFVLKKRITTKESVNESWVSSSSPSINNNSNNNVSIYISSLGNNEQQQVFYIYGGTNY